MFLALNSLGSSNYDQLPSPIFHHPHQECWRQAESPKTTVTTYPLLLRKPTPNQTTKKKSKQKNLKSKKEKKQHGTIQPSNHPPHTENSPFISHLILLQNSPRPSLWCLSLGWSAVNIPSRSTDGEDPQQGFPWGAVPKVKPLKLDLYKSLRCLRILRLYIYIYHDYRLHIHMVCL